MAVAFRAASNVARNATSAVTIPVPTGTAQGDLMIALLVSDASNTSDSVDLSTLPSGWAELPNLASGTRGSVGNIVRSNVFFKFAGASEPNPTFNWTVAAEDGVGIIMSYSGVDTGNPFHIVTYNTPATGTSHASASTAVSISAGALVSFIFGDFSGIASFTAPAQMQPIPAGATLQESVSQSAGAGTYELFTSSPGTITRTWTSLSLTRQGCI